MWSLVHRLGKLILALCDCRGKCMRDQQHRAKHKIYVVLG